MGSCDGILKFCYYMLERDSFLASFPVMFRVTMHDNLGRPCLSIVFGHQASVQMQEMVLTVMFRGNFGGNYGG